MEFTYRAYSKLLELLRAHHYSFCNYQNYRDFDRCVIMRHDIDYNIEQAVRLAQAEADFGIQSTYFVLLSSDFYNPASISSYKALHSIVDLGHNIGLHFDETVYNYAHRSMEYYISKEARILSELLEVEINSFSLHRPNAVTLETELEIPGFVNSYSEEFFQNFKYHSVGGLPETPYSDPRFLVSPGGAGAERDHIRFYQSGRGGPENLPFGEHYRFGFHSEIIGEAYEFRNDEAGGRNLWNAAVCI